MVTPMTIFPRKRLIKSQEDCHVALLKAPQTLGMSLSDRPSQVGEGTCQESALTRLLHYHLAYA